MEREHFLFHIRLPRNINVQSAIQSEVAFTYLNIWGSRRTRTDSWSRPIEVGVGGWYFMCSYCWMCQVGNSEHSVPTYVRLNATFLLSEYQWSAYGDDLPQERRFGRVRAIAVDIIIRVAVVVGATDRCCCSTVATVPQCCCTVVVVAIVGYLVACRQWECSEGSARGRGLLLSRVLAVVVVVVMILRQYYLGLLLLLLLLVEVVYRYRW